MCEVCAGDADVGGGGDAAAADRIQFVDMKKALTKAHYLVFPSIDGALWAVNLKLKQILSNRIKLIEKSLFFERETKG